MYWLQVESTRVCLRSTRCRGAGPRVNFRSKKKGGKAFYSFHPYGTICFVTVDRKLD